MAQLRIQIERTIVETDDQLIEAPTLAEAFKIAQAAYAHGPTEERPYRFDFDDCGSVTELEFQHVSPSKPSMLLGITARATYDQAARGEFDEE